MCKVYINFQSFLDDRRTITVWKIAPNEVITSRSHQPNG